MPTIDTMPTEERLPLPVTIGLALRAGRRRLGLSQRQLAERSGLSKSALARLESGEGVLPLQTVGSALAAVGLQLRVTDDSGVFWDQETQAIAADQENLRDAAGRRFPAHLEVYVPDLEPDWRYIRRMRRRRTGGPIPPLRGGPMYRLGRVRR